MEMTQDQSCLQQQSGCKDNHHHCSAWAARLQVSTRCGACCCARAAQALSKARASPQPCVWQQQDELCGHLLAGFAPHRAFEQGTASVFALGARGVLNNGGYGEQQPRRTVNTQQGKILICSTPGQDVAHF